MTRFGQWWKRARRGGYAAAEGAALHGAPPERHGVAQTSRALCWGLALPVAALLGTLATPWSLALFAAYPANVIRLALRRGGLRDDWEDAVFLTLGKFPEGLSCMSYALSQRMARETKIIEYK
jgi:hypothetical protein